MAEKVICIVTRERWHPDCRRVTEIRTDAGRQYTRAEAHDQVALSPGSIYVEGGGVRADLLPAQREGVKYVRTRPDDTLADNLLKVPELAIARLDGTRVAPETRLSEWREL